MRIKRIEAKIKMNTLITNKKIELKKIRKIRIKIEKTKKQQKESTMPFTPIHTD